MVVVVINFFVHVLLLHNPVVDLVFQRLDIHVANVQLPLLQHGVKPGSPVGTAFRRTATASGRSRPATASPATPAAFWVIPSIPITTARVR